MHSDFTVVSGRFARRLLHLLHITVGFFFFCFLLPRRSICGKKKYKGRWRFFCKLQGTHSNIITLLSVYESSELWHKHVPAPPHSAITPQKYFLSRHSVQRARGRQPPWREWQQNVGVRSPPNPRLLVSSQAPGRHGRRWISVRSFRLKMFSTPSPPR